MTQPSFAPANPFTQLERRTGAAPAPPTLAEIESRAWAFADRHDDSQLFVLWAAMKRHLTTNIKNWLSYPEIAAFTPGVSKASVERKLPILVTAGLLERTPLSRGGYEYRLPRYRTPPLPHLTVMAHDRTQRSPHRTARHDLLSVVDTNNHSDKGNSDTDKPAITTPQRELLMSAGLPTAPGENIKAMADMCTITFLHEQLQLARTKDSPWGWLCTVLEAQVGAAAADTQRRAGGRPPTRGKWAAIRDLAQPPTPPVESDPAPEPLPPAATRPYSAYPLLCVYDTPLVWVSTLGIASSAYPQQAMNPALTVRHDGAAGMTPLAAWENAYIQLETQFDRNGFDTWVKGTEVIDFKPNEPGGPVFVLGAVNSYARDMLRGRLYRNIQRVLSDAWGAEVEVDVEIARKEATPCPH